MTGPRWRLPAEGDRHAATWLAWPTTGYTLGDTAEEAELARRTWAAVANAAAEHEPVRVVADPRDERLVRSYLSGAIDVLVAPLDDAWIRDSGPTFVVGEHDDGTRELGAVDWVFNGWGAQPWATWDRDALLGRWVAEQAGATVVDSPLVNEGGGIHTDGRGIVLATDTVQLDPGRNPDWTREQVEAEFARVLGATTVLWLPRGLHRDSDTFGTRGHVDIVATFPAPGRVLLHDQRAVEHPDFALSRELRELLTSWALADGATVDVVPLPAPDTLRDEEGWVDYSYINHSLVNGGVIACGFGDARDAEAAAILADQYPGRTVTTVDARPLFTRGGGIHCITLHQPAL
ncbi:agmatine/peptidylarginine deiminase [Naasia sp. SYSU D00057]|uniref:agmatine deiminase family protein n=1 Tax=Naasia sp. SYSU D00057 TaxID=2817380 RepID=UPI001B30FA6A|nr:agmatine deiminase family protein [Naasia sp. SYSU D00057]